ncbi:MAG: orotidine-5'-phosphate decarboxylase [Rhodospirillaceae bacterium]|nr:orotidine-5'-phosphate decarboxylase [Rhodospirillaceae bacterium]
MAAPRTLKTPIFTALDTAEVSEATGLAAKLADSSGGLKLGLEFFCAHGPKGVKEVQSASDLPIFLDLKLHDIPNTVAGAMRSVAQLGVFMTTVHAIGGQGMMEAAVKAATDTAYEFPVQRPLVIAVTVLTSFDANDLKSVGVGAAVTDQVRRLAGIAQRAGVDGIVCSPLEVAMLRQDLGPTIKLITPGVRPTWSVANDQKRILTPSDALAAGADYLVIGRPITAAADPAAAAARIAQEIAPVSSEKRVQATA